MVNLGLHIASVASGGLNGSADIMIHFTFTQARSSRLCSDACARNFGKR